MLNFIEDITKKVEINTNKINEEEGKDKDISRNNKEKLKTYKSNPSLLDLKVVEIMTKENGVSFEYPIYKKRKAEAKTEKTKIKEKRIKEDENYATNN